MKPIVLPKIFQPFYCEDLIRLGKDNDGGYIVNKKDLKETKKLLSLGVGDDWSFERDFAKIKKCPIISYDAEVSEKNKKSLKSFFKGDKIFVNKNIGKNKDEIDLSSILEEGTFLKCDIEGAEYNLLKDIIQNTKLFTGLAIEFHDIQKYENFNELTNFMSKINQKLVHVHVNNCGFFFDGEKYHANVIELTFSSSENISLREVELPNKLDMPNCIEGEELCILF